MEFYITFERDVTGEKSYELIELANLLEKEGDFVIQRTQGQPQQGVKTGIAEALAIANFALAGIGTLLSILNHWRSSRPKTKMTIRFDSKTLEVDNITTPEQIQQIAAQIEKADVASTKLIIAGV